ncbi:MAG: YDG domain-containing protein, partial [Bifidobacteriaceae bacterium]|nr:YDG domain-containing protein [Bifidobacteriaceae bacterium]
MAAAGFAVAVLSGSGPARAAGPDPAAGGVVVVVDKAVSLTGSVEVVVDASGLGSKVVGVENSTPAGSGIGFTVGGVPVGSSPTRVDSVADPGFDGVLAYTLTARVGAGLAPGDYRVVSVFEVFDERAVVGAVKAVFEAKTYDGSVLIGPAGEPVPVGLAAGEEAGLSGLVFRLAQPGVAEGVAVGAEPGWLTGPDAWRYRLAETLAVVQADGTTPASVDITPKPLTVTGLVAQDKVYDGTTAAALAGTPGLSGV